MFYLDLLAICKVLNKKPAVAMVADRTASQQTI